MTEQDIKDKWGDFKQWCQKEYQSQYIPDGLLLIIAWMRYLEVNK